MERIVRQAAGAGFNGTLFNFGGGGDNSTRGKVSTKDIRRYDEQIMIPKNHLLHIQQQIQLQRIPPDQWVATLISSIPNNSPVAIDLCHVDKRPYESHEDHYKRVCKRFISHHSPTETELAQNRQRVEIMAKDARESLPNFRARMEAALHRAFPDGLRDKRDRIEWQRIFVQALEPDMIRELNRTKLAFDYSQEWVAWVKSLEPLYTFRDPSTAATANQLQRRRIDEMGQTNAFAAAASVNRPKQPTPVSYLNSSGEVVQAYQHDIDPFAMPQIESYSGRGQPQQERGGQGRGGRGGRGGRQQDRGSKRERQQERSLSPPAAAGRQQQDRGVTHPSPRPTSSSPPPAIKDEPRSKRFRVKFKEDRQIGGGQQSGGAGDGGYHRSNAVQDTQTKFPSSERQTRGPGDWGPCSSCGLGHSWAFCYRNPASSKYKPEHRNFTGPAPMAKQPGYKLGDEWRNRRTETPSQ